MVSLMINGVLIAMSCFLVLLYNYMFNPITRFWIIDFVEIRFVLFCRQ